MDQVNCLLGSLQYRNAKKVRADVSSVLSHCKSPQWRPWTARIEEFESSSVLSLHGGLMTKFKSQTMILPVRMILPLTYPQQPPVLRLRSSTSLTEDALPVVYISEAWTDFKGFPKKTWQKTSSIVEYCQHFYDYVLKHHMKEVLEAQLHSAARDGQLEVLQAVLFRETRWIKMQRAEPEDSALETDDEEHAAIVRILNYSKFSKESDKYQKTPLHVAVEMGHLHIVCFLLERGGKLDDECNCPRAEASLVKAFSQPIWLEETRLMDEVLVAGLEYEQGAREWFVSIAVKNQCSISLLWNLLENYGSSHYIMSTAVLNRDTSIIEVLIEWGLDVNHQGTHENMPLCNATTAGNTAAVHMLLDSGADLHCLDSSRRTLLHRVNRADIALTLLDRAIDVDRVDRDGWTALFNVKDVATMKVLIEHGASVDYQRKSTAVLLHHAEQDDADALARVQLLLASGAVLPTTAVYHGNTPLHCALAERYTYDATCVCAIIEKADATVFTIVNDAKETLLHKAARRDSVDCLELILRKTAEFNISILHMKDSMDRTALHTAAMENNTGAVKRLIAAGAKVNERDRDGNTPLHFAARNMTGKGETASALIKGGAEVNARDKQGQSPLLVAVSICNTAALRVLLRAKDILVNDQDAAGKGVWHVLVAIRTKYQLRKAADRKRLHAVIEMLQRAGADINLRDPNGRTALHAAVISANDDFLLGDYLPMSEVRVNEKDSEGKTALHYAASRDSGRVVFFLLEHGADKSVADNSGQTPEHCPKNTYIRSLLQNWKRSAEHPPAEQPSSKRRKT